MNNFKATATALLIALAVITGTQNWRATAQAPLGSSADRSQAACKIFETRREVRNAGAWNSLHLLPVDESDRTKLANTELERLGGSRTILEIDASFVRKEMLEQSRNDLRQIVRDAKLASPTAVSIRDDTIQFLPRAGIDDATLSSALSPLVSGPMPLLTGVNLDTRSTGDIVILAVPKRLYDERRRAAESAAIRTVSAHVQMLGVETALIQPLGEDRILVVLPGIKNFERLQHIIPSRAKLKFQIVDRSNDPCSAPAAANEHLDQLIHRPTSTRLFVKRALIASGEDLLAVAVITDTLTGEPAVAFRFNPRTASRMTKASADNIGMHIAIALDDDLIDAPMIREPLIDGAIQLSGGLNIQKARELEMLLGAGMLPPPIKVVETQVVEPR